MGQNLEFGLEVGEQRTTLSVSGPSGALRNAGKRRTQVKEASKHRVFRYSAVKPGTRPEEGIGTVGIDARKTAGIKNKEQRRTAVRGILDYLHFLGSGRAKWLEADPKLRLCEGIIDPKGNDGDLAAIVKSPDMSDPKALEEIAWRAMAGMATDLGYAVGKSKKPHRNVSRILSASISEEGVVLSADDNNGARLATGTDYDPEAGLLQMYGQDLTPAQQLICLSGVVEIAQADSQLAPA